MAASAERHEVRFIVRAALRQRENVMYILRRGDLVTFLASLAQGISRDEAITHTLPRPAVALLHGWVTLIAFVTLCFLLGMFLAEPSVGKLWTA